MMLPRTMRNLKIQTSSLTLRTPRTRLTHATGQRRSNGRLSSSCLQLTQSRKLIILMLAIGAVRSDVEIPQQLCNSLVSPSCAADPSRFPQLKQPLLCHIGVSMGRRRSSRATDDSTTVRDLRPQRSLQHYQYPLHPLLRRLRTKLEPQHARRIPLPEWNERRIDSFERKHSRRPVRPREARLPHRYPQLSSTPRPCARSSRWRLSD